MDQLRVEHVTHRYENDKGEVNTVLRDVSFTWLKGESLALMGESGSGKSTLARLCIGLETPSEGQILFDGEPTGGWKYRKWRARRREIQAVFQDANGTLNPQRSVYQNMSEALVNLTDMGKEERKKTLLALMAQTGLSPELLKTPVRKLSGGEQRRISLLRALALHPDFLVLDEVTSGLDLISTDSVLTLLEEYRARFGCSYLFITHDWKQASRLCSRVIMIEKGVFTKEAKEREET
ncbi:MAG: ABC transporter ATP-binding protein [Blautia sp.]|nr:ABC transporter ATP-binding protein [Blautia sp.]